MSSWARLCKLVGAFPIGVEGRARRVSGGAHGMSSRAYGVSSWAHGVSSKARLYKL